MSNRNDLHGDSSKHVTAPAIQKLEKWCEWSLYAALLLSVALLGIGRLEIFGDQRMRAWSVSRTSLGFWLLLRIARFWRDGSAGFDRSAWSAWLPLTSFFAVVTLSLLPDFRSPGDYRYLAFAIAHAVVLADVFGEPRRQRWLLVLIGVSPLVLVVRGIVDAPEILKFNLAYRFDYPLDHANTAGYLLAMSIPLGLFVARTERGWRRYLAAISSAAQMIALLLTHSRGAWLGFGTAMLFLLIGTKQWKGLAATLAVLAVCALALPAIRQRIASVLDPWNDAALSGRMQLAEDAFRLGVEHPILGVGYGRGRLKEALRSRDQDTTRDTGPVLHTHNLYLELFAETGLLGLGTFLWLLLGTFYRLLRRALPSGAPPDIQGGSLAASWLAAMVAGLGDIPFYHHEPRILFFSLFAAAFLYCRESTPAVEPLAKKILRD